eukprot:5692555-Pyramimonas_sp.AAC.1
MALRASSRTRRFRQTLRRPSRRPDRCPNAPSHPIRAAAPSLSRALGIRGLHPKTKCAGLKPPPRGRR